MQTHPITHPSLYDASAVRPHRPVLGQTFDPDLQRISHLKRTPHPRRILLAEDDTRLRRMTTSFLRHEGYTVHPCSDGLHALEMAERRVPFDLLLTDFDMPHVNGLELAQACVRLRAGVPVVLVSGSIFHEDDLALIHRSGWRLIHKPCPVPKLLAVLRTAIEDGRRSIL